jgi:hypothetical protein
MLRELKHIAQIEGEPRRRWFVDEIFDLIVWYDDKGSILSFQLCYDKEHNERALTWKQPGTYTHHRVDDGESKTMRKATPVLVPDGKFDYEAVAGQFKKESKKIDKDISGLVLNKLLGYKSMV